MICLTMIVKNEAHVIERALSSVKDHIDCWYVSDTGSTDGTQELIQELLAGIPGKLEEVPWVDFATNRTQALRRAEMTMVLGARDYHLILDADDQIDFSGDKQTLTQILGLPAKSKTIVREYPPGVWPPSKPIPGPTGLTDPGDTSPSLSTCDWPDAYSLQVIQGDINFRRTHLLSASGKWRWRCPVHEYMHHDGPCKVSNLDMPSYLSLGGGGRSHDPEKYLKDAFVLEKALKNCDLAKDGDLVSRMIFYLAQSFRDAGETAKAIFSYTERYKLLKGYVQERYVACLELAALDPTSRVAWYRRAFEIDPFRVEAPFRLAKHYWDSPLGEGYALLWATYAASLPRKNDALFCATEEYVWSQNLLKLIQAVLDGKSCR